MELQFKSTSWSEVEGSVKRVNPALHKIISKISPDDSYKLYHACYPYGTVFVENGLYKVPDRNGNMVPITSQNVPNEIRDDLGYNKGTNPVTLIISNQAELYIEEGVFDIPSSFGLISPGHMLSTTYVISPNKIFQPKFKWCLSAGARSIFTLPKITNRRSLQRLKKAYELKSDVPKHYSDHFNLFKEMVSHSESDWNLEIIFFSKKWFDKLHDDAWRELYNYLLVSYQCSYQSYMNKFMWDIVWSFIIKSKELKPSLYIANTIKHLLFMAAGATCGMGPALDNHAAPVAQLQQIFLEVFSMKDYLPTIFIPKKFDMYSDKDSPVYYSLNYPNMMEMTLRPRQHESLLTDLYETYLMLNKYIPELKSPELNLSGTPLYDVPDLVQFSAFHQDASPYQQLKSNEQLALEDPNLTKMLFDADSELEFNHHASFFRGCVRVGLK